MRTRSKPILFITPHHVGTWFFLNFLLKHKQIGGFCCHSRFERLNKKRGTSYSKLPRVGGFKQKAEIISINSDYNLYHAHPPYEYSEYLHMLVNFVPTFVAIRDPLIALISHIKRYPPGTDKQFRVRGQQANEVELWKVFVRTMQYSSDIFTIPMDLLTKNTDVIKTEKLTLLLKHCGLDSDNLLVFETVQSWAPVNCLEYPEKEYYYNKDMERIEKFLGPLWTQLRNLENEFRPYLERFGYKNLLWWS